MQSQVNEVILGPTSLRTRNFMLRMQDRAMQKLKRQRAADMPRRRTPAKRPRPLGGDKQRRIHTGGIVIPARSPPTMGANLPLGHAGC